LWALVIGGIASFGIYRTGLGNVSFGDAGTDVILLVGGMIGAAYTLGAGSSAVKGSEA
jgi:hypothetical protein